MQTSALIVDGPSSCSTAIVFGASAGEGGAVAGPGKPSASQLGLRPPASGSA